MRTTTVLLLLSATLVLAACQAAGALAYDLQAETERQRCDRMASQPERQACLARVRTAEDQAKALRKPTP